MKIKFLSLLVMALVIFACSKEESNELNQDQQPFTMEIEQQSNTKPDGNVNNSRKGGFGFVCDPNWEPDTLLPGNPIVDKVIDVYWSDDPNDWPLGVIDIECARQEYFKFFCGMYMSTIQPSDPYRDTWLRDFDAADCIDNSKSKDHVDTQSNGDDRVCTGPNCD
jgi:hypothetical protein